MPIKPITNPGVDGVDRVTAGDCADLVERLGVIASRPEDGSVDGELIELLSRLESLKAAACAAQARLAVRLDRVRREHEAALGLPAARRGRGVAAEVALARRESPHRGSRLLGLAKALVTEMPHTMAALARGDLNEWRATLLVRETAVLEIADRAAVDAELAGEMTTLSDRRLAARARQIAYRLDPGAPLKRGRHAASQRYVSLRPAPDTMAILTAYLPAADGVAAYAALRRAADTGHAAGDDRGRGQIMADTLIERLTGRSVATGPDIDIQVIMTDHALFATGADADEPATLAGYGPIPAALARDLARGDRGMTSARGAAATAGAREAAAVWVRRLYADAPTGILSRVDTRRRRFTAEQRRVLILRDQECRTPWCGAPIREADHVHPQAQGGPTSLSNGQGLCQRCNQTKESPGWHATTDRQPGQAPGTITLTAPSGTRYQSLPPPLRPPSTGRQRPAPPIGEAAARPA